MQHQRFRENENTAGPASPLYDGETVRRVLGRAAEIESQAQQQQAEAPLTPAQVEALGVEVGLSPGAVRRALGELHPGTTSARADNVRVGSAPTVAQMASTPLPGLIYGALVTLLFYLAASSGAQPGAFFRLGFFACALVVPQLLSMWLGWRSGNRKLGMATGFFLAFFACVVAPHLALALAGVGSHIGATEALIIVISVSAGVWLGAGSAMLRERREREQAANGR